MSDCRIVVVSCPARKPLQEIWKAVQQSNWADCPFPITFLSPEEDIGWNANLLKCLESVKEYFVLLMLDDNWPEPGENTENVGLALKTLQGHPEIAMIKLQAGGAHAPEIPFKYWNQIREYDRRPHPFKRTNLVPAMYRRAFLQRLSAAVLAECGPERDRGRDGAIEFEITGTKLTGDAKAWPERLMGIHRPGPNGSGGDALLACMANDAVTGGKIRPFLAHLCEGVPGAEVYL